MQVQSAGGSAGGDRRSGGTADALDLEVIVADGAAVTTSSPPKPLAPKPLVFDESAPIVEARPAATVVLLRACEDAPFEICVMQRSLQSSFMGGAVVFPGGRVDVDDRVGAWPSELLSMPDFSIETDDATARIAACRESLEEVGLLPIVTARSVSVEALRSAHATSIAALREALARAGAKLDLASLEPLARWVTPEAEQKRFDTRFFVARAPRDQEPRKDDREAIRVVWASARRLLEEYERGEIGLFPPTHRTLQWLLARPSIDACLRDARAACHDVICPRFKIVDGVPILALPGDPLHEIRERRIEGASRYVLRDAVWRSEEAT
jgi:8-oxo-dGTP pyrophosphatase MutT (NUDIX family)